MIDQTTFCENEIARPQTAGAYLDNNDATAFFTATGDSLADRPDADQRQ